MTQCKKCNQPLPAERENASSGPSRVFCSDRCRDRWHANETKKRKFRKDWLAKHGMEYPMKACLECGSPFNSTGANGKTGVKRCSEACKAAHLKRVYAKREKRSYQPIVRHALCWYCQSEFSKTGTGSLPAVCSPECGLHHQRASRYGLTREEYTALPSECEICGGVAEAIDHCHDTGKVRGHLCKGCNSGIGFLGADPGRVLAAWIYLSKHQ